MIGEVSPGLILILGALLVPLLKGVVRSAYMLALPALAFAQLVSLPYGDLGQISVLGLPLVTLRIDRLSTIFGYIFLIASFLGVIYTLYHDDWVQNVAGLVYSGSAVGAVFAGDLVTLFLYWEGTAIASVFLIWASRTERSFDAGMRYLIIQIGSGVLLLAGTLIHFHATQSIAFNKLGLVSTGTWLIFLAFGIKCAFPLLHNWLQDSYPEATPGGAVMLSAFTTKLAVYALARGYAGTEILVPIGAAMTAFPIFYAVIENDLRRVLAYSLNNQLGFMVVGIGIGSELALNGTAAHAFCHILYKALLFMSMGAVLLRAGTVKGSELGGLYKSMPWTDRLLHRRCRLHFRVPVVQRLRLEIADHRRGARERLFLDVADLAVRQCRRLPSLGNQDPLFRFLRAQLGQALRRSPRSDARSDGADGVAVHRYRRVAGATVCDLAFQDRLPPLHRGTRRHADAAADVLGVGFHLPDADRPLSARVALGQP